jgi:hypothetical protein
MIQFIGAFLLMFSLLMCIVAETTDSYMWLMIGGIAYIIGLIECFIVPVEGIEEDTWNQ